MARLRTTTTKLLALCALLVAALGTAIPAPAQAAKRSEVIKDCADDGRLQGNYSKGELRDARQNLPTDVDEYTDCRDVLRRAETPESASGGGAGTGGTGTTGGTGATSGASGSGDPGFKVGSDGRPIQSPLVKEDYERLEQTRKDAAAGSSAGGLDTAPASSPDDGASIPGPVLVLLILLGLTALGGAGVLAHRRGFSRRTA